VAWRYWRAISVVAFILTASCGQISSNRTPGPLLRAPDHVLLWSTGPDTTRSALESIGFHVRGGQTYPEGISSSTIVFEDWSYIELLHFSAPERAGNHARAKAELAFALRGPGSNSFAVQASSVDAAHALLRRNGFAVADIEQDMVDPDGPDGPAPSEPASWRDFHFSTWPTPGVDLFFIQYPPEEAAPPDARRAAHNNSARRLSAVWVRVADLDTAADAYRRMTFSVGHTIEIHHLNARARIASLGAGAVVLVETDDLPDRFRNSHPGPGIFGLSVETASLENVKQTDEFVPERVESPLGAARLFPLAAHIGLFVEFHERE
jgi:Glyoxalase-like domain